jgi:hypothetical protein
MSKNIVKPSKVKVYLKTYDLYGAETNVVVRKIKLPNCIQYSYVRLNRQLKIFPVLN